jgi:dihydroorotase-like cyclic amidohydrolase
MKKNRRDSCQTFMFLKDGFDSSVSLGEPGFEDRETIGNGLLVAIKVVLVR